MIKSGTNWALENAADDLLFPKGGDCRDSDILSESKARDIARRELLIEAPDASVRSGMFKRASNPKSPHLNSVPPNQRPLRVESAWMPVREDVRRVCALSGCGRSFSVGQWRDTLYCSDQHSAVGRAVNRTPHTFPDLDCPDCGSTFTPDNPSRIYCYECGTKAKNRVRTESAVSTRTCRMCPTTFEVKAKARKSYCSAKCIAAAHKMLKETRKAAR